MVGWLAGTVDIEWTLVKIFQVSFKSTKELHLVLRGKAWKTYFEKFLNSEAMDAVTDYTFPSWIATS